MERKDGWTHPTSGKWLPNLAYQPGQLLRCVGPWFHEMPPEQGHLAYDLIMVKNTDGGPIRSVGITNAILIPQGAPLVYLGVWIPDTYYIVMGPTGPRAVTCYSVVDDPTFWGLVDKGEIDLSTCKMTD